MPTSTGTFSASVDATGLFITRVGDTMTHGARLIFGSPTKLVDNLPVIRIGDLVSCPIHGNNPIVSGCSPNVQSEGLFVSRLGAMSACGAMVISGSTTMEID